MKKPIYYDTECYHNLWLIAFYDPQSQKVVSFEQSEDQDLDIPKLKRVLQTFQLRSFNGRSYDMPMIAMALSGADCAQLKALSDSIITQNLKPWDVENQYGVSMRHPYRLPNDNELDHVDIIEVAPGMGSLKQYGGRVHAQRLQDLPYEPDLVLNFEERQNVRDYCGNDLVTTAKLCEALDAQIKLREAMSLEYEIDLRSKSDAQIAEAVIASKLQKLLGCKIERPRLPRDYTFQYKVPDFVQFISPDLQALVREIEASIFTLNPKSGGPVMPASLMGREVCIGKGVYRMGIGGLHSSESEQAVEIDDDHDLIDRDVASYYPAIILNCKLFPEHLGAQFLHVYRDIVNKRLEAKRAGNTVVADSLKITINGSFGKLGSMWSKLYAPDLMIQVTVTGQLCLLMLIESLEACGIPVVSANTDGIVMRCPKRQASTLDGLIAFWECMTGFVTEETRYTGVYSRDVNNYFAVKPDGKVKTKGAYAPPGLMKNPANVICAEAVADFLAKGKPVEQTIYGCSDIRKFVTVRRVTGGAEFVSATRMVDDWVEVAPREWMRQAWLDAGVDCKPEERKSRPHPVEVPSETRYLGKVVRTYYATGARTFLQYAKPNKSGGNNRVPRSEGARPLMDLPDQCPDDLDREWFVRECREILMDIGHTPRPVVERAARRKLIEESEK